MWPSLAAILKGYHYLQFIGTYHKVTRKPDIKQTLGLSKNRQIFKCSLLVSSPDAKTMLDYSDLLVPF